MISLQAQYNLIVEGRGNIFNFKQDAMKRVPTLVNHFNSYEDIVTILVNKSIISEGITDQKEQIKIIHDADRVNPYELEKGVKYEMKSPTETWKMAGAGKFDISEEDYLKAKLAAIKNINKDPLFYTRLLSGQKLIPNDKRTDMMKEVSPTNLIDKENGFNAPKKTTKKKEKAENQETLLFRINALQ